VDLKYCDGRPMFVVDGAPWLREVLERLGCYVESFGERSLAESVYSSFSRDECILQQHKLEPDE
jgi:transposase-like protein